jgi:hypothetical protein
VVVVLFVGVVVGKRQLRVDNPFSLQKSSFSKFDQLEKKKEAILKKQQEANNGQQVRTLYFISRNDRNIVKML